MTEKLFWTDPYQQEFTAKVVEQLPDSEGVAVLLDRTCFYATSGGQPNDLGTLNDIPVRDVRQDGDRLLHILTNKLEDVTVRGRIDWHRRFDHMQQHTGQHILSAAFFRLFAAETSSFHLGEEYCSIELSKTDLDEKQIGEASDAANEVIFAGTPVDAFFVDPERVDEYPLRKKSDLKESLRLVKIGDFDLSPCSGTHLCNAAEAGMVFIYGFEKLSRTTKVNFLCGRRVLLRYHHDLTVLKSLSKTLTTSFDQLPDSVGKLMGQVKDLRKENQQWKEERLKAEALELLRQAAEWDGNKLVIQIWSRPYQEVRFIAQRLSEQPNAIGALTSSSDKRAVFFKNPAVEVDLKSIFQRFLAQTTARGGGPPHFLEAGGLTVTIDLFENLFSRKDAKPQSS